jgi:hypothetical protein
MRPGEFDRPKTPAEIIDKLEQRIGHEGRVIFENFVHERASGRDAQALKPIV